MALINVSPISQPVYGLGNSRNSPPGNGTSRPRPAAVSGPLRPASPLNLLAATFVLTCIVLIRLLALHALNSDFVLSSDYRGWQAISPNPTVGLPEL